MEQQTTCFKSLTLKNFRFFDEMTFSFDEQFNVLVGQNGTGKSTVLDALKIPLTEYLGGIRQVGSLKIEDTDIRGQIVHHDGAPSTFEKLYPCEIAGVLNILGTSHKYLSSRGEKQQASPRSLWGIGQEYFKKLQNGYDFTLAAFAYYGVSRANRLGASQSIHTPTGLASRTAGYEESFSQSLNPQNFAEWLKTVTYISLQEGVESGVMKAMLDAVYTCLPEVAKIEFRIKEDTVVVSFNNDTSLRFDSLSDGYRAVMALAADIAHKMAKLNPHLGIDVAQKTPGIVLIDELDLHLHPKWQRRIVGDLKRAFPLVQFITTTHSPFIIQSLELGEVLNLGPQKTMEEDFNALSIEDIAEEVMDIPVPQRSEKYQKMYDAATEYFDLLEQMTDADEAKKNELENKLNELSEPFSDDVAYYAFLNSKRIAASAGASRKGKT